MHETLELAGGGSYAEQREQSDQKIDVKRYSWFQLVCKIQILAYVAFSLCTSMGSKVCELYNVISVMHVHMYVRLVWRKATVQFL